MSLRINKKTYVKDDPVQLLEVLLVFDIVRGNVLREVGFAQLCDGLVEGQPVKFLNKSDYVVLVEVALPVDGFLDLNQ
jgi:hypothetical protein